LKRYIDVPVFILASVATDLEPLAVMVLDLPYRVHGFAHTFIGAAIVGACLGILSNYFKKSLSFIMQQILRLQYATSLKKFVVTGIFGAWFHVLLDSPLYMDIRPFYPFTTNNPLQGIICADTMYSACVLAFLPAIGMYVFVITNGNKRKRL